MRPDLAAAPVTGCSTDRRYDWEGGLGRRAALSWYLCLSSGLCQAARLTPPRNPPEGLHHSINNKMDLNRV